MDMSSLIGYFENVRLFGSIAFTSISRLGSRWYPITEIVAAKPGNEPRTLSPASQERTTTPLLLGGGGGLERGGGLEKETIILWPLCFSLCILHLASDFCHNNDSAIKWIHMRMTSAPLRPINELLPSIAFPSPVNLSEHSNRRHHRSSGTPPARSHVHYRHRCCLGTPPARSHVHYRHFRNTRCI